MLVNVSFELHPVSRIYKIYPIIVLYRTSFCVCFPGPHINPLTAKLFIWNFHPLEVVSRWRDPQLQVGENYLQFVDSEAKYFHPLPMEDKLHL